MHCNGRSKFDGLCFSILMGGESFVCVCVPGVKWRVNRLVQRQTLSVSQSGVQSQPTHPPETELLQQQNCSSTLLYYGPDLLLIKV